MNQPVRVFIPASGHVANANAFPRHPADRGSWIWHPDCPADATAVLRFTLQFELAAPICPVIHVTGDQRFQLRCDGRDVTFGPDRCDLEHWTVQSISLPLGAGRHAFEAIVWWIAEPDGTAMRADPNQGVVPPIAPPMAQITWRGGFLLFTEDLDASICNTGVAGWKVENLTGAVRMFRPAIPGYHDVGPSFDFDLRKWEGTDGAKAEPVVISPPIHTTIHGVRRPGWCLFPANLPEQERVWWTGGRIRAARASWDDGPIISQEETNLESWQTLFAGGAVNIPTHSQVTLLWDFETYRCGYPQFSTRGGAGSLVEWEWSESLFEAASRDAVAPNTSKGHRGEILGKVFLGFGDRWRIGSEEVAEPPSLWWRAGRYVRIRIATQEAPLVLERVGVLTTGFPLGKASDWRSSDPEWDGLMRSFETCYRVGAHETWTDTPYYEQMCYVGDNFMHARSNYAWFSDDRLSRRSLELFEWSRRPSGFVAERYPSGWRQESLTYAMLWPIMIRDYAYWRDDREFVRSLLPGMRCVLAEMEGLPQSNGLIQETPGWPFIDWVPEWNEGCGPGVREGDSSIVNLHWVLCLQAAAEVEEAYGDNLLAIRNRNLARQIFNALLARFWDDESGLLLDTAGYRKGSEHAQFFALLTGLLDADKTRKCLAALKKGEGLSLATISSAFYLLDALYFHGEEAEFHRRLQFWRGLPAQGFVCTPEMPEPARSDAHAWGAHPAWHSFASIAGIRPAAPGFRKVRIAPCPGPFERIQCSVMHPRGIIEADMCFLRDKASATITLPENTSGQFVWRGVSKPLAAGTSEIELT